MLAVSANTARSSLPVNTASLIVNAVFWNAVADASTLPPDEAMAVAKARTSDSDNFNALPKLAREVPIMMISDSVEAKLFPSATIAEPKFETSDCEVPMMFMNLAMARLASSPETLVVSPNIAITFVNSTMSFDLTPS